MEVAGGEQDCFRVGGQDVQLLELLDLVLGGLGVEQEAEPAPHREDGDCAAVGVQGVLCVDD